MHGTWRSSFQVETQSDSVINFSPGRFFATNEVKAMLAYVLLNYDVTMANVPSELWFGLLSIPDPTAEVMFRKRMT